MQFMAVYSRLFYGLSAFAAVVEAGSFVRAGEVLGQTQSAVSRSVQRLEERLGLCLFELTPGYGLPRTANVFAQRHCLFSLSWER